ncbi:hypothetical protein [Rothia nasimurium]|uniref:hypothetical protein n=1 Tax=Rothia nasimurium TaxID=85336 RepID=UPI003BA04302
MPAHVLLDGSVYSPADPFATALVVNEGLVEWVGQVAGARSIVDDSMKLTELEGALVAPSFALAAASSTSEDAPALLDSLAAAGYGSAHLMLVEPSSTLPTHTAVSAVYYLPADSLELSLGPDQQVGGVYVTDTVQVTDSLLSFLEKHRLSLVGVFEEKTQVGEYLTRLASVEQLTRVRISPRLDGLFTLTDEHLQMAKDLQVSLGFSSDFESSGEAFGRALAAGASVTLGSDPLGSPQALGWELVNMAVNPENPDLAVSARSAFQSMTRAVYRAAGASNPFTGQIVPGAPAHLALWEITELMVQTPDSRISAWSTDPRARTPLLPVLSADVPRPHLLGLYRDGLAVA